MSSRNSNRQPLLIAFGILVVASLAVAGYSLLKNAENTRNDRTLQNILSSTQSDTFELMLVSDQAARGETIARNSLPALTGAVETGSERILTLGGELEVSSVQRLHQQSLLIKQQTEQLIGLFDAPLPSPSVDITGLEETEAAPLLAGAAQMRAEAQAQRNRMLAEAAQAIRRSGADMLATIQLLDRELAALPQDLARRPFGISLFVASAFLAIMLAFVIGLMLFRETQSNLTRQEDTNERNQEAILRLLDEIADLAEGDLTVNATVTEDFTGAIADSINYAIEQLRELVARVASTAESVASSANETRATSERLSEASEHQAAQINETNIAIGDVASSLTSVATDAAEIASVAQNSVAVASTGNRVVQDTISGMNNIREQIQDTAKRIKRLGESSQEIGDIVSLINEIADQTNILALNASIQAAMAGEAGRGFAVVADEVQNLAERAANSTKQIEALVRTIQSDTNEAVASMEQTTSEVVRGAALANNAGQALTEIQSTSENLARLILAVSTAAKTQSEQANRASRSMRVIADITEQTLAGSNESGQAVGHLAEQALALRASVSDFKLPRGYLAAVPAAAASAMAASAESSPFYDEQDQDDAMDATAIFSSEQTAALLSSMSFAAPPKSEEVDALEDLMEEAPLEMEEEPEDDFLSFDIDIDDDKPKS